MNWESLKFRIFLLAEKIVALGSVFIVWPSSKSLKCYVIDGDSPVNELEIAFYEPFSQSRIAWKCSLNEK